MGVLCATAPSSVQIKHWAGNSICALCWMSTGNGKCSLETSPSALGHIPHSFSHTHINTLMAESVMQGADLFRGDMALPDIVEVQQHLQRGGLLTDFPDDTDLGSAG